MTGFVLDARLNADTIAVGELDLSTLRLMNDRRYAWAILAPRRAGIAEFHELTRADRALLAEEIGVVSEALSVLAAAHKMNVAMLGNIVRQLHVHVVARSEGDPAWPGPVWGRGEPAPYAAGEGEKLAAILAKAVGAARNANAL